MRFKYCPHCGTKLVEKDIGDEGLVPFCESCDIPLFDMFSSAIIVLVVNEYEEAALLSQHYLSTQYYNLVSGYIKPRETAEFTAIREVKEEIGIDIDELHFIKTYWFEKKGMMMIGFIARAKKQELRLSKEVNDAKWVPVEEALGLVHPNGSTSFALVDYYLNHREQFQKNM